MCHYRPYNFSGPLPLKVGTAVQLYRCLNYAWQSPCTRLVQVGEYSCSTRPGLEEQALLLYTLSTLHPAVTRGAPSSSSSTFSLFLSSSLFFCLVFCYDNFPSLLRKINFISSTSHIGFPCTLSPSPPPPEPRGVTRVEGKEGVPLTLPCLPSHPGVEVTLHKWNSSTLPPARLA